MFYSNSLNLIQVGGGTQVKQGDLGSKFSYKLANEKDQELDDFDKEVAHINLVLNDKIVFTTTATVDNSTVTFNIDKPIPVGLYFLEIKIRDYIFPSDKQTSIFVQSGAVPYYLKELVPNYDINMTLKDILSDLSQKGIDIKDLNRRADEIIKETTAQLAQKANKDEVTNVMTPKGTLAYASLPTSGNQVGWYYYCPDGDGTHGAGNYVWNGTSWFFGGTGDEGYNLLKKDLADVRTEKETNLLKFIEANWTTSDVIVSSNANSSVMHIKANNLTLASQQVFNVMLNNLIILEPNTTYTISTSIIRGEATHIRANNIALCRRDNYENIALVSNGLGDEQPNNKSVTFTTPSDETRFYLVFTFAKGTWDCDIDLNINISKGSEPNYKQYGIVVDLNNALPTIDRITKHNVHDIVVAKDGSGDFASLTEAVENAKDFDVIYVKNGVYDNEIVKAWLKTVFIVGESRDGVIIKNNTGEYSTPPIEMGTGMLKNLTVYAEGNATPTNKGYALHSESSVEASACDFFMLENCTLKSDYRQSWGMGMRGDTHYYARNCTFEEVYFHDCEHAYRATNQSIEFDSCNIIAKASRTALVLQDQQMSSANVNLMFNRCLVKSENGANIKYGKWTGSGVEWVSSLDDFPTWHLSTYSFGNSDNALND